VSGTETIADGVDARVTKTERRNHVATSDPTANDDSTDGYTVGSWWFRTDTNEWFICNDATPTAAVWVVVPTGKKTRLQTTDGASTLAASITLADPETVMVDVLVTARRTDAGTDHAAYQRKAAAYRNGAGAVLIGAVDASLTRETDASWDVTITVSGNDLQVNVQGAAGQTIEWHVRCMLERV
jgi:hypothetical protein